MNSFFSFQQQIIEDMIDHRSHPHPLHLKPPGTPYRCSGCRELGFGSSYCCENSWCEYILHEECANVVSSVPHRFFPKSYFEFYEKAPGNRARYCDACGKDVKGFVYHCSNTGNDLHPRCLNLKDTISDEDGCVTLKLCQEVPSKCVKCKHRKVVENKIEGWSYVSSMGNCCYHVSCFKDLILENWNKGYFSRESNSIQVSDDHDPESQLALTSMVMVQGGGSSRRSRTIKMWCKIGVVVFKLIFSAIFGNPISAMVTLVEALVSN